MMTTTPAPAVPLLTVAQLVAVMPGLATARAEQLLPHLLAAVEQAEVTTPLRLAAFLAQVGHESGSLRYFRELASGEAYEGRRDLGNVQPGDGVRFRGRGPIQVTGRANYAAASAALGVDLVARPELAELPEWGFKVSAWYWTKHALNALADARSFDAITRRINGGLNGKADRDARYARAKQVLGVSG